MRFLLFPLCLLGCADGLPRVPIEPTFVHVDLEGDLGSMESPLEFTSEVRTLIANVRTLDAAGEAYPFEGDLKIRVRPGRLQQDPWITVSAGEWTGEISFEAAFGPTRIWFSDEGDKQTSSDRTPSFGTGISPAIHIDIPTIAQMQEIEDHETNQLEGEFAELRVLDREVVVTQVGTNGFWVTDLLEESREYASLYVYSFSKPEGISEGDRLLQLTGNNQEYLATTQLSFPSYEAADEDTYPIPDPILLDVDQNCLGDALDSTEGEKLESSLVEVQGLRIPNDFCADSNCNEDDYLDYIEYGQWPIETTGGCRIYVSSATTIQDFDPLAHAGAEVTVARGMLSEIWGKWILVARGPDDLQVPGFEHHDTGDAAFPSPPSPPPSHSHQCRGSGR